MKRLIFILALTLSSCPHLRAQDTLSYAITDRKLDGIREIASEGGGLKFVHLDATVPTVKPMDTSDLSFVNNKISGFISTATDINKVSSGRRLKKGEIPANYGDLEAFLLTYSIIKKNRNLLWMNFDYEHNAGLNTGVVFKFTLLFDMKGRRYLPFKSIIAADKKKAFEERVWREIRSTRLKHKLVPNQNIYACPIGLSEGKFIVFIKTAAVGYQYWEQVALPLEAIKEYLAQGIKTIL